MTCHFVLPFSVWLWGDEVTMQVFRIQKRVLTRENIRSQYDAWKGYLKKGIREIAKASMGNSSRGFYSILHESPAARGQRADAH